MSNRPMAKQYNTVNLLFAVIIAFVLIFSLALATESSAKAKQPSDYDKAVKLYNRGKYKEAIPLFEKAIAENPTPEAHFMLGYSLYKIGKNDEARIHFKQSYNEEPEYTPTPDLEKKLNRKLNVARPGPQDEKQAVPIGSLPPEAEGLDPSQYKIIDNSERLKIPETTQNTNTFTQNEKPKPSKPSSMRVIEPEKPAASPKPAPAPAPVADTPAPMVVADSGAPVSNAASTPVEQKSQTSQTPAAREGKKPASPTKAKTRKSQGFLEKTLDTIKSYIPEDLDIVMLASIGGGVLVYLILTIVMIRMAKNNGLSKILMILAVLPVLQLAIIILSRRAGGVGRPAAKGGAEDEFSSLSGEPELDLPDVDDMDFDMGGDDFASDSGFGSDEGVGGHSDDFGTAESESGGGGFDSDDGGFDTEDDFAEPEDFGDVSDSFGSEDEEENKDGFGVDF